MTTETLDKLYLEWSQFTKAKTAQELSLMKTVDCYGLALMMIREGCDDPRSVARAALTKTMSGS
jgi:hypothetical protein